MINYKNVPPSLVSDSNQCGFLNSIGLLQYSNKVDPKNEKIMNGGSFMVMFAHPALLMKYNTGYSIKQQVTTLCYLNNNNFC